MPDMTEICADLKAELDALDAIVAGLDEAGWDTPTPAENWTVRDQIAHLAFFDERAAEAVKDYDAFMAGLADAMADAAAYMDKPTERGRAMSGPELLEWWRSARTEMLEVFAGLDPKERVAWYGPPMSAVSFASARLMEAWAHGQDVADGLGARRQATDRLRHIAHLGVRARGFSYTTRGLTAPEGEVRVELTLPSGAAWSAGPADAADVVRGGAEGFCLVVTQRRHHADTDVVAEGDAAREWMSIAQAFAGPPGAGRQAGQFG